MNELHRVPTQTPLVTSRLRPATDRRPATMDQASEGWASRSRKRSSSAWKVSLPLPLPQWCLDARPTCMTFDRDGIVVSYKAGNANSLPLSTAARSAGAHDKTLCLTLSVRYSGLRLKAAAIAKVTGEKAAATTAQLRQKVEEKDWTKEREYLGRTQKNLQGCGC